MKKTSLPYDALAAHKLLLALSDTLALVFAFFCSFTARNLIFASRGGVYWPNFRHCIFLAGLTVVILFFFRHQHLYRRPAFRRSVEHLDLLTRAWLTFVAFFLVLVFFLRIKLFAEHRITVFLFFVIGWAFLYCGRFLILPWATRTFGLARRYASQVLCISSPAEAERVASLIMQDQALVAEVAGYLGAPAEHATALTPRYLGDLDQLPALLDTHAFREAFVRLPQPDWERIVPICKMLTDHGIRVRLAIDHFGALNDHTPRMPETEYGYIYINESPLEDIERAVKHALDWIGASLGLLLCAPLFAVIGILIRIESPGPVFFRQRRMGQHNEPFEVFKFRTMRANTENHHREAVRRFVAGDAEYMKQETGKAGFYKVTQDDMVTHIGRFLRRTSLDELPQLINVWRGEMSLIGPRPLPVYEVELLQPWQRARHEVRPGITGFWQVFGRSAVSHKDTILMDIFYIMNWSLSLDFRILVRTFFVMLTGKGGL